MKQGDERLTRERAPFDVRADAVMDSVAGLTIDEFTAMVEDARAGGRGEAGARERR